MSPGYPSWVIQKGLICIISKVKDMCKAVLAGLDLLYHLIHHIQFHWFMDLTQSFIKQD